jgi:hypothetical protein
MKRQLLDFKIWMTNWVPTFKQVEKIQRDEKEEKRRKENRKKILVKMSVKVAVTKFIAN